MSIQRFLIHLCTLLLMTGIASPAVAGEKPNILWLISEDNSAEWVGCYGNPKARTPHIDRLAEEGFRYTKAFANIAVCSPTRGAWVTGVHALSLGIQPMRSRNEIPHDRIAYLPDLLKPAGYYTANAGKTDYNIGGRPDKECWDSSDKVKWSALPGKQPFFQVVNIFDSHESRAHGSVEKTRFNPDDVELPPYHPDIPAIRKNYAKYYDAMENMDRNVGEALAKLEAAGLAENTIVIYNSDHGGVMPRSKRFLFNTSIHCPLVIRIPEKYKSLWPAEKPGTTVDRLVSFIDMPKTWLSLAGAEQPAHLHGSVFLGPEMEPETENEFSFGYSERQGDAVDSSRSVRGKRYYYVKRYMPYVPWGQHASYTWRMVATQAWEAHHLAGKTDAVTGRFFGPKPHVEELYDTQTDPHCIHNLIEDPAHAQRVAKMRQALRDWQLHVHDSGLIPEEELYRRSKESGQTIYDLVRDRKRYNLPAYLDAADLALAKDAENLGKLRGFLKHTDAGVRYWGVVGCLLLGEKAESGTKDVLALTNDPSHTVRAMAAYHLFRIGRKEVALQCLEELLAANTYASMRTLSVVSWIGEEALPLQKAVKNHQALGNYTEQRQERILESFSNWSRETNGHEKR